VRGAGPTGALAALALADAGWIVDLQDPQDAAALTRRSRAYAISHSSARLLRRLDLWHALQPHLKPFRQLHLLDRGTAAGVLFDEGDAPRWDHERSNGPVGWILAHAPLMAVLLDRLASHASVALRLGDVRRDPPDPGALVVACDGPLSPTRGTLGLGWWQRPYSQSCLTAMVGLRGVPADAAFEVFRAEGPLAVLPMADAQHQVVWSVPSCRAGALTQLDDTAFLEALAGALPEGLEPESLHERPRAFPVAIGAAASLCRGSTVLVGEAAHRCHPVGGQGLNLCWRDVAALHALAARVRSGRLPLTALPRRYARRRWPDILATLLATDLLVRLFSNRRPLLLAGRRLALALLARHRRLRRTVLKPMTLGLLPGR
jgi:2-octaprenyl-6-methoxyphenol hydroxylase